MAAGRPVQRQFVTQVTACGCTVPQPACQAGIYAGQMHSSPQDTDAAGAWQPRRLATFQPARPAEPLLRDWLRPSRDALFRWTMAMAASADGRRAIAEMAVSIQRLRGADEFGVWLYAVALQAALHQPGGLPEASLTGLPPELRAMLRLVARRSLRREEAMALLVQRMGFVRRRLVQTRLAGRHATAPQAASAGPLGPDSISFTDESIL